MSKPKVLFISFTGLIFLSILFFANKPFLLILYTLPVFLYVLAVMVLYFFTTFFLKVFPSSLIEKYTENKNKFRTILLFCLIGFLISSRAINFSLPQHVIFPFRLILMGLLLYHSVVSGVFLLSSEKKNKIHLFITTFALVLTFISLFIFSSPEKNATQPPHPSLKSLPYLKWVPLGSSEEKNGVTGYDSSKSYEGFNVYHTHNASKAHLMDMDGNNLHTWQIESFKNKGWHHVEPGKNGILLAVVKDTQLIHLDRESQVKWTQKLRFHHDIGISEKGDIYTLSRDDMLVSHSGLPVPALCDFLTILSWSGEIKKRISFYDLLKNKIPPRRFLEIALWVIDPAELVRRIYYGLKSEFILRAGWSTDIFHVNTVEIIDKEVNSLFAKGDVLFSACLIDLIGVVNIEEEKLIWSWGQNSLEKPHHPTLLENGNILVFDNGNSRKYSRVLEIDPKTGEIVWKYQTSPPSSFYSDWGGASQRLPNGNTLITETSKGRAFEVTAEGEIVWEFYNPERWGKKRGAIYRLVRITDLENYGLKKLLEKSVE